MGRVLIISPDVVNGCMAGPGIRYWEMARALSRFAEVTLATPRDTALSDERVELVTYDQRGMVIREHLKSADVVVIQGFVLREFSFLKHASQPLVVDLYDPFLLENLETHRFRTLAHRHAIHCRDLAALLEQLRCGDFFLCASERQRDYWLGMLAAVGKVDLYRGNNDASLRDLIDVVSFGLPEAPARHTRQALKGALPGIEPDDRVIVWGGGIWAWLDPLLLIRAMKDVSAEHSDVKLFFMGRGHPNPQITAVKGLSLFADAVKLARNLGLLGRSVFFNDQWVAYEDRQNYLLEADVGVSLHKDSIEMRYALRTRLFDCVWCGLPIVVSKGDIWSETIEAHGLGRGVPVGDLRALIEAILAVLDAGGSKARYRDRFDALRPLLTWERVIQPLVKFIASPHKATDSLAVLG